MRCIAAVARAAKAPFVIEPIDVPEPAKDEVLVRIVGVGICATDLASRDGLLGAPFPSVFGHERAGVVERVGSRVMKVDRKSTRLNSSHRSLSRMPSSA